jgi:hypothetical protein
MNRKEYLLTKLAEECMEVGQRATKALTFSLEEIQEGQDLTNAQRIELEFIDLCTVYAMLQKEGWLPILDEERANKLGAAKEKKIEHYGQYSLQLGTLKHDKVKLMVCGHGRHGKDTLCEFLGTKGYTFNSSSWVAAEAFIFDELKDKYGYKSVQECWDDRINKRAEWYDMISTYNGTELTTLAKYIYANYDIYCGIRSPEEFLKAKAEGLFEISIWVDASDRLPAEGVDSNGVTRDMCDIVITNNGTLEEFMAKLDTFYTTFLTR